MAGANYSIFGCSSSRRKSGAAIFKALNETANGILTGRKAS